MYVGTYLSVEPRFGFLEVEFGVDILIRYIDDGHRRRLMRHIDRLRSQ